MDISTIILFAIVIMSTYFIEWLIGFGGTILALPIASFVLKNDMQITVIVLTIVVLIASIIIAIRDFKFIDKKQLLKITLIMLMGIPIGMIVLKNTNEKPLKIALGIFMIFIGIKGIYSTMPNKNKKIKINSKTQNYLENLGLFLGGIVHGAFTCGGPFVVVYATKNIKDKSSFRATLCALWAILNSFMLFINIISGSITKTILNLSFVTICFVIISIYLSNIIHKKINSDAFSKFVYIALCISGTLMAG
ncbi:MAG: TSUP family transporter [Sarcina sp.]